MTHAPASAARMAVASADPSSITRISRHAAAARSCEMMPPIAASSLNAGITIDTADGSAKQLLHDAIPCDLPRPGEAGGAEARRERAIGREPGDRGSDRRRLGRADESVLAVDDEFERTARIGAGDDRFAAQEGLERHVAVIFVERDVDHRQRSRVETHELVAIGLSRERYAIAHAAFYGGALGGRALRSVAGDDQ